MDGQHGMEKTGILTFHYSNNFGAVLQAYALARVLETQGLHVEIINFIPQDYRPRGIKRLLRKLKQLYVLSKSPFGPKGFFIAHRITSKHGKKAINAFDNFRSAHMRLSRVVDESTIANLVGEYGAIVVGSDQIWNPSQRSRIHYFLDFGAQFTGRKISYAADSTISTVAPSERQILERSLGQFHYISVRNQHTFEFVRTILGQEPDVVADPTLLHDFGDVKSVHPRGSYILVYVLGKEIQGSNVKAIQMIKQQVGNLPVYSIKDPTIASLPSTYADQEFYELSPLEWVSMVANAAFVFTDSFHGALFSMKYHRPFLAYYTEALRSTRLIDVGKRYGVAQFVINSIDDIATKGSLLELPDYAAISPSISEHLAFSKARIASQFARGDS